MRHTLTQDETDILIRSELVASAPLRERSEILRIVGPLRGVVTLSADHADQPIALLHQRGGIDSDPLVRMLAHRAWGDRDRRWFEDRGVRNGERVAMVSSDRGSRERHATLVPPVALAWFGERSIGATASDAPACAVVEVIIDPAARPKLQFMEIASRRRPRTGLLGTRSNAAGDTIWTLRVSERERAEPDQRQCPRCDGLGLENYAVSATGQEIPVAEDEPEPDGRWTSRRLGARQCSVCHGKCVVRSAR